MGCTNLCVECTHILCTKPVGSRLPVFTHLCSIPKVTARKEDGPFPTKQQ